MAWSFDEVNDYVTLADDAALTLPNGDWFIGGWVKLDDNAGSANQYLFQWGQGANPHIICFIGEDSRSGVFPGEVVVQFIDDNSLDTGFPSTDDNQPFTANTAWTYVGVGRDGDNLKIVIDGTVITTFDLTSVGTFIGLNSAEVFYLGAPHGASASLLGGDMQEWAKWDRFPSASELIDLANQITPISFPTNLKWYCPMKSGSYVEVVNSITVTNNGSTGATHEAMTTLSTLAGSSSNAGVLSSVIQIIAKVLAGVSSNVGNLAAQTIILILKAVAGVSSNAGALSTLIKKLQVVSGVSTNTGLLTKLIKKLLTGIASSFGVLTPSTKFSARWSVDFLESRTDYDFPTVYVEVDDTTLPTGAFTTGVLYERRILEMPRLQEVELDSRFGISGFQRVTLRVDNSDGLISSLNLQDAFVRMFFVDDTGNAYKEFKGKVVDWTLSHECIVNVEDIDAIAITQDLPLRTLNDLVDAEKIADGTFANFVVANDLGKPIPIIFGRAVKVPLLYVKANESSREYDYILGEGEGLSGGNFQTVFTVYRQDQALDSIEGDVAAATSTTLTLETADKRPDSWYKFWYVQIIAGTGVGQIRDVTAYDSATNKITVNSAWSPTPNTSSDYRLREWRFYDGSQASPYDGYAFIRFKKRMGVSGRTDPVYADVNGFGTETNPVRAIQSVLNNSAWGLNLGVDTTSFNTAAALSEITTISAEGAIISVTSALEMLRELLGFRDMVLNKDDSIQISVDQAKTSIHNFGLGDETGWNNIQNTSPEILHLHPNEKVKNLNVRYRKNYKENDTYLHELERSSSTNGVDQTINLPFVYAHDTADRWLDYKRKRFAAAVKRMNIEVGQDGKNANRGQRATISIPSLGLQSQAWEIAGANVTPAGNNSLSLVPYSASPYTYVAITAEGGTLPVDESFDITPDFAQTIPDPVGTLVVTPSTYTSPNGDILGRLDVSWTPPNDPPYEGAEVFVKENGEISTLYKSRGIAFNNLRIEGLENNKSYDVKVLSVNGELRSIATESFNKTVGSILPTPSTPATPTASRFGRQWRFTVNPNLAGEKISHYVWEIATSAGTLQDTVENAGTEINWNVSGTSSVSYKARVKAVNIYGKESGFSSYSSVIANEGWQSGHYNSGSVNSTAIGNSAVDENRRINMYSVVFSPSSVTLPSFQTADIVSGQSRVQSGSAWQIRRTHTITHNKGRKMAVTADFAPNTITIGKVQHSWIVKSNTTSQIVIVTEIINFNQASVLGTGYSLTVNYW